MTRGVLLAIVCFTVGCSSGDGGGDLSTGGNDLSTGGNDLSTGGADLSSGSADLSTGGSDFSTGGADLSSGSVDLGGNVDLARAPDLAPSGTDCFFDWKTRGTCGAPVITASYLSNDCDGTTGVFVVGTGFQSANQFDVNNGFLEHGPYAIPGKLNRDTWNVVTPTMLCITTASDPTYWSGFTMQIRNPDGQTSNSVTVQNLLGARPPLPSTGSSDPWDRDACLDAPLSRSEALAHFAPAATTATLGTMTIQSRSRPCNSATGCGAFGAPSTVAANVTAGLAIAGGGSTVDFTLGGTDCGALDGNDYTVAYNNCTTTLGSYSVHVASHCLMLILNMQRSSIAADGSYTETDYGSVLRY